jgi:lipoyl-dependent peroxiredoxin
MPTRNATAEWKGDLKQGGGTVSLGSGAWSGAYSFTSRFENGSGTNPEELIAAAHAGCFSMALANMLSSAGHPPTRVHTVAKVHIEKQGDGFAIPRIELETEGEVPGMDEATFRRHAENAKAGCPVSKVLAGAEISLKTRFLGPASA